MADELRPFVVLPGEGEALWSAGCLTFFKANAAKTGDRSALIDEIGPRSFGTPLHRHSDDDESFYVLEASSSFISATVAL